MEPYEIRQLPDVNAVLITVYETWNTGRDAGPAIDQLLQMMDEASESLYYVSDVTPAKLNVDDVVQLANLLSRGKQIFDHPNLKQVIVIATSGLITLAVKGMNTATFGNVDVKPFTTLEEAMDYMRHSH